MLRAVAIDDEPIALEVIRSHASKFPFIQLKETFTDAFKAIEYLQKEKIDLIFLDIKMPDISGIELLKSLSDPPMVIFTTGYSEHAVQSFELDAIDYLLKPFSLARFLKACNKANEQYQLKNNKKADAGLPSSIFIKSGYGQVRIELNEIFYAESSGNYVQLILKDKKILTRLKITEMESVLLPPAFIRIHRSYIVAVDKITRIEKNSVWLKQVELPIGAAYAEAVNNIAK